VRDALSELQHKTRLLEDERDYFVNLQSTTERAYDQHKRELQSLLVKERGYFASSQRDLEAQLSDLLRINQTIDVERSAIEQERRRETDARRRRFEDEERRLRTELADARETLRRMAADREAVASEAAGIEGDIKTLLETQQDLRASVAKHQATRRQIEKRLEAFHAAPKPFIPSGRIVRASANEPEDYLPATQNIHAKVQTIEARNFRMPMENRRLPSTHSPAERLGSKLIHDIVNMRMEYDVTAEQLDNPYTDASLASSRMKDLLKGIEKRKLQLKKVRDTQLHQDEQARLHVVLGEIARENNLCERLHGDLVTILRSNY
jgi:hypothetical protein